MKTNNEWQQRAEILESRYAFQEEHIQQLNRVVAKLQQEVMELNQRLAATERQLRDLEPSPLRSMAEEPPPPHY